MQSNITDPYIIENWLKGWSLSRGLPAPIKHGSALKVDVGLPEQKMRYVFANFTDELTKLANTIVEPLVFLKVCAAPEFIKGLLPARWVIDVPGFLMTCFKPMLSKEISLPNEYVLEVKDDIPVSIVKVLTADGHLAASGRLAFTDDFVIYDRIETDALHRRKGLATIVLKTLESIAISRGKTKSILVATEAGKAVYETLGWNLYSLYTSAVIPETK